MEEFATDNLILLEFLVENVSLEYGTQQNLKGMKGEMCVSFQFLDNTAIYVCEEDFAPRKCPSEPCSQNGPKTKNGKSCLFAMSPQQAENCLNQFDVYVSLFKKMKPGTLPDKIAIGESLISIVGLYNEVVNAVKMGNGETPVAKTLKDQFSINNYNGELVGQLGVYIRMSCFGKLIVTQFQMNLQDKSVEFKAKEGHYLFKYNKKDGRCPKVACPESTEDTSGCGCCAPLSQKESCPPDCPPSNSETLAPCCRPPPPLPVQDSMASISCPTCPTCCSPCPPCLPCPPCVPQPTCPPPPCPPCIPCIPCSPCSPCPPCPTCSRTCTPCPSVPCQMCGPCPPCVECQPCPAQPEPPGPYQEIGAEMGGNRLLIRVHKETNKVEITDSNSAQSAEFCPSCCCKSNACGCNPSPPSSPACPCDPKAPFSLKVGGKTEATKNICVTPPACSGGTGPVQPDDPNREMFILRIGKKSQKANKKNNLELELCTPKAKEIKPPPKLCTQNTQCFDDDFPDKPKPEKAKAKGGKGKGKGKKGKK